ncbi:porin [Hyphomicrobium sp. xq]|uniref:Porin n=1 Tax=Hyphomicrobium album TaxID=2665159 RepID=A0A6I3KI01_9HYPH|nr:porin [Hyphomicrobium album]MTD93342.1 porin [Hyphomicrobium album]
MFGGVGKAGWATILVAGGLMLGTSVSAQAADLGGDCCADLEERIAELEATTARKGNRKVSLTISGYVDKAVMYWDDGGESNAYVVDNDFAQTRFWFTGKATIATGWTAGYRIEIGLDNASSDSVSQFQHNGAALGVFAGTGGAPSFFELRQSHWFIESEDYGKVSVGLLSGAQDDMYKWGNVGKAYSDAELHYNGRFFLKQGGVNNYTNLIWDNVANNLDNQRVNAVRYDTPKIFKVLVATASWGEDDIWDVGVRFDHKFGSTENIHVKAGISYTDDNQAGLGNPPRDEPNDLVGSFGISEAETGLYFYGAAGRREFDDQPVAFTDEATYYYGQVGINRKLIDLGSTNFHVDYGRYDDWGAGTGFDIGQAANIAAGVNPAGSTHTIVSSEVTRWGFGATQNLKAAEMDIYAVFNHYEADITATSGGVVAPLAIDDWWAATAGGRINF